MSFEEFAAAHLMAFVRLAMALAGDRAAAEDITQDVLVRVHARWRKISQLDRPEFYVRKMIVNEFLSARRRSRRLLLAGHGHDLDQRVSPDHAVQVTERAALQAELRRLPRQQQAVLVLRYYAGLSDPGIAEVLGCTPGTVRGYAARALAALRVELPQRAAIATDEEAR